MSVLEKSTAYEQMSSTSVYNESYTNLTSGNRCDPLLSPRQFEGKRKRMIEDLQLLNVDVAVTRLLNDRRLYHGMLRMFRDMHGDDIHKMDAALRRGQSHEVAKILHRLRGAAAIVGADQLDKLASVLLHQKENFAITRVEKLRAVFVQTIAAVQSELDDSS